MIPIRILFLAALLALALSACQQPGPPSGPNLAGPLPPGATKTERDTKAGGVDYFAPQYRGNGN